jgi:hypothetical protein
LAKSEGVMREKGMQSIVRGLSQTFNNAGANVNIEYEKGKGYWLKVEQSEQ